jgi:large subunit ribosomal protein L35
MPKLKTKSSAKKRFKVTGTGKVRMAVAGKRHGMRKRSNRFLRQATGFKGMSEGHAAKILKHYLPGT